MVRVDHYLKLAEGYMQTVFKVLERLQRSIQISSSVASGYMSTAEIMKN